MQNYQKWKKYFAISAYNKFTSNIIDTNIKEKKLVNESHIANFVKETDFDNKLKNIKKKLLQLKQNMC